jgi:hypothetical protein
MYLGKLLLRWLSKINENENDDCIRPKVLPHVKKNPYIVNQNYIFSKKDCEVISG